MGTHRDSDSRDNTHAVKTQRGQTDSFGNLLNLEDEPWLFEEFEPTDMVEDLSPFNGGDLLAVLGLERDRG